MADDSIGQSDSSADGSRIAAERGDNIVLLDASGEELRALTSGDGVDDAPSWSPDGKSIAFNRVEDPARRTTDVFVVELNGSARNLTPGPDRTGAQPDWSPNGDRIVFQRKGSLFVMAADGSGEELHVRSADRGPVHEPAWSPNQDEIALWIGRDVYVYSFANGLDNVTDGRAKNPKFPSWSPDGKRIAFAADDGIWTIKRDGTGLAQLVEGEGLESPTWRRAPTTTG